MNAALTVVFLRDGQATNAIKRRLAGNRSVHVQHLITELEPLAESIDNGLGEE